MTLAVRPHRVWVGEAPEGWNAATGTLRRTTYVGDVLSLEVTLPGGAAMTVEQHTQPGQPVPAPGDAVSLCWLPEDTLCFPRGAPARQIVP